MSSSNGNQSRGRWAARPNRPPPSSNNNAANNEDDLAMAALLGEANQRSEEQKSAEQQRNSRPNNNNKNDNNRSRSHRPNGGRDDDSNDPSVDRYRRPGDKRIVEDDEPDNGRDSRDRDGGGGGGGKRRRRWNDRDEAGSDAPRHSEGNPMAAADDDDAAPIENPNKVKADFGLSGALANDAQTGNVYNGVTLKFSEPPEARIPNTRWRLYVFRKKEENKVADGAKKKKDDDDGLLDTFHISRQSAYLFGRERKVADIPVDHPSLSKQHAVLQYRALPSRSQTNIGAPDKLQCKPYLLDLESTNGTFINGVRLDSARYYELRRGDVITFGASSREYVLLTEQSARTGI